MDAPTVNDNSPATGATFTLSATVRNAGDGESAATTLRFYRSTDGTITTSDTSVDTAAVGGLAAGAVSSESISLTAPSTAGTYSYGACVDAVTDESNTANNCSAAVTVTVAGPTPAQSRDDFAYWDTSGNGDLTCAEAEDRDEGLRLPDWLSRAAIAAWKPEGTRTRGAPPKYSDLAIETALTLRLLFHLPLRQAEGFLTSLYHLMGLDLRSPDHTTLSRRGQHLNLTLRRVPRRIALHLFIDSTGLSMVGEGEWAAAKHGRRGRRGWKKLHLGVDQAGVIVAQALTDSAVDDASTGIDLIETIASSARTVTADAAYDTLAFYETANTRGTTVVVPPAKTAKLSRRNPRSSARDGTIRRISKIGRRRWKKEVGYHRQARVENAFFRYKSILGDRLRSRTRAAQAVESVLACNVLNRMTELGRPESFAIDR